MVGATAVGVGVGVGFGLEPLPPLPHPSRTITLHTAALPNKALTGFASPSNASVRESAQRHTPNVQFNHPENKPVNSRHHTRVCDTKLPVTEWDWKGFTPAELTGSARSARAAHEEKTNGRKEAAAK